MTTCGACHRPPAADPAEIDYRDPWNVRHQPLYLTRSACYVNSGALTCMGCHDPHAPTVREQKAYNARCASCHTAQQRPPAAACPPPADAACSSCHLPKVSPQPGLVFTNHWIGVFEPGSLIPRR